jgi:hypothetical protein
LADAGFIYPEIDSDLFQYRTPLFLAKIQFDAPGQLRKPGYNVINFGAGSSFALTGFK